MKTPQIFYYCYSHNNPRGGQKHTYQHVDILNRHGYRAFIVHAKRDFRLTWFSHAIRPIDLEECASIYRPEDYIVLPEDIGEDFKKAPGRKVIFNKGLFLGFYSLGESAPEIYPYHHRDVVGVLCNSEHNQRHLNFAYPALKICRVYCGVDTNLFRYRPLTEKAPVIAYVPKAEKSLRTLYHMLQSRYRAGLNNLDQFEWVKLEGKSEFEVAEILQQALIFIFLDFEEGMPRTLLEAMACGALVIGYAGGPLIECLPTESQFEPGNLMSIAEYIEAIAADFPDNIERWRKLSEAGRRHACQFSLGRQEESVVQAWESILS